MSDFPTPDHAAAFIKMGARIDLTKEHPFGGAFVIVGPDGEAHSMLILDEAADPATFFGSVMTRCQIIVQKLQEEAARNQGFRR